ncbi:MAG: HD domain-containing protein [Thermoguttaceae bacterium]
MRDSSYGPRLEPRLIRKAVAEDKEDGFEPGNCLPSSAHSPDDIASELLAIADKHIGKGPLLNLIRRIFKEYRIVLFESAASRTHHRSYQGGLLEHTSSVTKLTLKLYEHFCFEVPHLSPTISKPLLVAGAILHDVGKILDSQSTAAASQKTLAGNLIGHQILGLEIVERFAAEVQLDDETKYQLEHLILTHSRFPDWGSPFPPATLEAMLLHYADYADSTFVSALKTLDSDFATEDLTRRKGPFGTPLLKPRADRHVSQNHLSPDSLEESSSVNNQPPNPQVPNEYLKQRNNEQSKRH